MTMRRLPSGWKATTQRRFAGGRIEAIEHAEDARFGG